MQYVKCGFAGENFPTSVFPCVVGRPMLRYEESLMDQELTVILFFNVQGMGVEENRLLFGLFFHTGCRFSQEIKGRFICTHLLLQVANFILVLFHSQEMFSFSNFTRYPCWEFCVFPETHGMQLYKKKKLCFPQTADQVYVFGISANSIRQRLNQYFHEFQTCPFSNIFCHNFCDHFIAILILFCCYICFL